MVIEPSHLKALMSHGLFGSFSEQELASLFNRFRCTAARYAKGQIIHLQNERCTTMEVILQGRASVQKIDENGNVLKIAAFSNGDLLGANLLFSSRNEYPYTVIADRQTTVISIGKDVIVEMGQRSAAFLAALMGIISDRVLVLTDKIDAISLKTIRQRVTDVLKYEYYLQGRNPIVLPMTKKELAQRLGIPRTSLSRELNKMRGDGLSDYDAKTIGLLSILDDGK